MCQLWTFGLWNWWMLPSIQLFWVMLISLNVFSTHVLLQTIRINVPGLSSHKICGSSATLPFLLLTSLKKGHFLGRHSIWKVSGGCFQFVTISYVRESHIWVAWTVKRLHHLLRDISVLTRLLHLHVEICVPTSKFPDRLQWCVITVFPSREINILRITMFAISSYLSISGR